MSGDMSILLAECAEAQCRVDEVRDQLFDEVKDARDALGPLDGEWVASGPHSEEESQWYRESTSAIRSRISSAYLLQEAEQERAMQYIPVVRALALEMVSSPGSDQTRLLTTMRDFANERVVKLQEVAVLMSDVRSRVHSFTDEVDKKISQKNAPAKKSWWK